MTVFGIMYISVYRYNNFSLAYLLQVLLKETLDDLELLKASTGKRLPYAYLIWKNPKFKNKPDPIQYCSCCDGD